MFRPHNDVHRSYKRAHSGKAMPPVSPEDVSRCRFLEIRSQLLPEIAALRRRTGKGGVERTAAFGGRIALMSIRLGSKPDIRLCPTNQSICHARTMRCYVDHLSPVRTPLAVTVVFTQSGKANGTPPLPPLPRAIRSAAQGFADGPTALAVPPRRRGRACPTRTRCGMAVTWIAAASRPVLVRFRQRGA